MCDLAAECLPPFVYSTAWCGEVADVLPAFVVVVFVDFFACAVCAPSAPQDTAPTSAATNIQPGPIFFMQCFPSLDSMTRRV